MKRILLIEDDDRVSAIDSIISKWGYEVIVCSSFDDAVEELEKNHNAYFSIMLDLAIDASDLPDAYMQELVLDNDFLPGYVFLVEYLEKNYSKLAQRTMILSGFANSLKRTVPSWHDENIKRIVQKSNTNYKTQVRGLLAAWEAEACEK